MKAMLVIMKCEHCGKETAKLVPLEISEDDWLKTQEMHGEMVKEVISR